MFQAFARPSLWDAYTGWGADFVWWVGWLKSAVIAVVDAPAASSAPFSLLLLPCSQQPACGRAGASACTHALTHLPSLRCRPFLMHYPRDRIGVVDEVRGGCD